MLANELKSQVRDHLTQFPRLMSLGHRLGGRPCEVAVLRRLINPGDCVIDVGANVGQFSLVLSRLVGPSGQVHSFEPTPITFRRLQENFERYAPSARPRLNQLAVAETAGNRRLFVPDQQGLEASLARHSQSSWVEAATVNDFAVPVTTLDLYAAQAGLTQVRFVKVDVEGAELLVLRGARELLGQQRPALLIEIWSAWTKDFGYAPRDIPNWLSEVAGYQLYHVGRSKLQAADFSRAEPGRFPRFINFFAFIPGFHDPLLQRLRQAGLL